MTAGSDLRLAIVVVNYGSHRLLRDYLSWTFSDSTAATAGVVVVDNFRSAADSADMRRLADEAGWHLVASRTNVGFGAGVNLGARAAWSRGADAILVVNPDVHLGQPDVIAIRSAIGADPTAMVAPLIVDRAGRPWSRLGRVDLQRARLTLADEGSGPSWLTGACFGMHRAAWESVEGMDPDYFMYWEDVDLSIRLCRAGGSLRVLPDVVVVHDVGATQETTAEKSGPYYYYNCRNRLVFAAKLLRKRDMLLWVLLTPSDLRRVVSRGVYSSRAVKFRKALPPALHGCAAGMWWMVTSACRTRRGPK